MTIVKPNKKRKEAVWMWIFASLGIALVFSIISCGYVYAKTVVLRHDIASLEEVIDDEKTENAELNNEIFRMTDPQMLEAIAEEKGLVEDNDPQWVFASLQS
jgi:cell division protein FtsL